MNDRELIINVINFIVNNAIFDADGHYFYLYGGDILSKIPEILQRGRSSVKLAMWDLIEDYPDIFSYYDIVVIYTGITYIKKNLHIV